MDIANYLCKRMIKKLLPIMGLMLGLSVGSFLATARLVDISSYRMEQILNFSGIPILYYLTFLSVPIILIYTLETTVLKPGHIWPVSYTHLSLTWLICWNRSVHPQHHAVAAMPSGHLHQCKRQIKRQTQQTALSSRWFHIR